MTDNHTTRRMYTADWLDLIRDLQSRAPSEPSASVEISRNAKGDAQFSVKVYAPAAASEDAVRQATERAYDQAVQAYDSLCASFPHGQSEGSATYAREARAASKVAK